RFTSSPPPMSTPGRKRPRPMSPPFLQNGLPMLSPNHVEIEVIRFPHGADLPLPGYETPGAAGMDLMAAVEEDLVIEPGKRLAVPTGLGIALPEGYEAQIRPRSGLALKQGLT